MKKDPVNKQLKANMEQLYRLAKSGKSAEEIMNELDITDRADLKNAVINLMHEKGEDLQIPGLQDQASINPRYTEEGIRINPEMLSGCEFKSGDEFELKVEGDKITLHRRTV